MSVSTAAGTAALQQPRDARLGTDAGIADEPRQFCCSQARPSGSNGRDEPLT
jgi:hypothetical protein